ncbi:hypothetical protein B0T25DRAFT_537459 [Lasiosphaeria hispida]|uniref:Uncharacterized protein n=1 Tax=Lasiosphaeria hispida TaxID=260671 RepID=A0AAJ0HLF6_9PEZI|nr:hypothetical protein B0T25DRAFT_537459 [Lasiosphaeria hispida]
MEPLLIVHLFFIISSKIADLLTSLTFMLSDPVPDCYEEPCGGLDATIQQSDLPLLQLICNLSLSLPLHLDPSPRYGASVTHIEFGPRRYQVILHKYRKNEEDWN